MDNQVNLDEIKKKVEVFVAERNWQEFHSPKNLAMSISIEAAEIMEHFQWSTIDEAREYIKDPLKHDEVSMELADVLIYCLSFANVCNIDISEAILKKLEINESRFPKVKSQ